MHRLLFFLRRVCLLVISLALITRASAEAPPYSSAAELTLDQLIQVAIEENKDLQAGRIIIEESIARLNQAGLWPNPEIEFITSSDSVFGNEGEHATTYGFKQRLPISGRLSDSHDLARVDIAMAIAEVENKERLLSGEISLRARTLVTLDEKIAVNQELQKSTRRLVSMLESRQKLAEISQAELNLEQIELQKLLLTAASLANERNSTSASLNALLGRDPALALTVIGSLYDEKTLDSIGQLAHAAPRLRPDRRLMALSIDRAAAEIRLAKATRWEDWTIGFDYDKDRSVFNAPIGNKDDQFLGVSVSIPLPLWNQNDGKILETKASKRRAQAELAAIDLKIDAELLAAQSKLQMLRKLLAQNGASAVTLAKNNLALLEKSYLDGLIGISSLVQGQQQLNEIRNSYIDTKHSFLVALTEFETAAATKALITFNKVN